MDDGRADIHEIKAASFDQYYAKIVQGQPPHTPEDLKAQLATDLDLIKSSKADLVAYDLRPTAPIAAAMSGVPSVSVINAYWSPYGERIMTVPDTVGVRKIGLRFAEFILPRFGPRVMKRVVEPVSALRRAAGLDDYDGDLFQLWAGCDHVWFPDTDNMAPAEGLPETHIRVGPALWRPKSAGFPTLPTGFGSTRSKVYVSLGSTGYVHLLPQIVDGLLAAETDILISARSHELSDEVMSSGRVHVVNYIDGDQACDWADLVVSNGGHPQLMQAFSTGTPVLGVGANFDQLMAMVHAERTGAAISLHVLRVTPSRVTQDALKLLQSPEATECARVQKAEIDKIDTGARMEHALDSALR
ncbi:MAG: glycosyltransferase [Pseudomonadota bacterium]